jgi:hypothetical protein
MMSSSGEHSLTLDPMGNTFKNLLLKTTRSIGNKLGHNGPCMITFKNSVRRVRVRSKLGARGELS